MGSNKDFWDVDKIIREWQDAQDVENIILLNCVFHYGKGYGYDKYILIECTICGNICSRTCTHFFQRGDRCPVCLRGKYWTNERVIDDLHKDKTRENLSVSFLKYGDIRNAYSKLIVYCAICKRAFVKTTRNLIERKQGCIRCNHCVSKGEDAIEDYCINTKLNYERSKAFEECKDINKLPFDFYLPDYNLLIEYQGEQHYKPINYWNGIAGFKSQQKRDKIKKEWAISNGYNFLEIPFTEFDNIDKVLDNYLLLNCIH